LHGIPILLKDVVDTADRMRTTAGSLALMGSFAPRDAFIAERLRAAGAVILGKTNLSEWSNARSPHASSGWSARGGLTKNAYVLDRTACGSSSGTGVAIAANFATIGVGVETDGSIACPASANSLVGIKPTVGLVSRAGLIPVTYAFDTAGPLARTVTDAAILLGALAGADPRDPSTASSKGRAQADYTVGLDKGALKGTRIGVLPGDMAEISLVHPILISALKAIESAGAILVNDVEVPTFEELQIPKAIVQVCELKDSMGEYLRQRGPTEPHKSLADLVRFNEHNAQKEMQFFGQEIFETAAKSRGREAPEYQEALQRSQMLTRAVLDRAFSEMRLDAIVSLAADVPFKTDLLSGDHPMVRNSFLAAVAGYPRVTVPGAFIYGLPVGISFLGPAWSEARLIRIAYAFEQLVNARRTPRFLPTANLDAP
jgi:amidase